MPVRMKLLPAGAGKPRAVFVPIRATRAMRCRVTAVARELLRMVKAGEYGPSVLRVAHMLNHAHLAQEGLPPRRGRATRPRAAS